MDLNKINYETLSSLAMRFPENFNGLVIKDNSLEYQDKKISLNGFNINDLLSGESLFASDINKLSGFDIFNIIKIHNDFMGEFENTLISKYSFSELYELIENSLDSIKIKEYFREIDLLFGYEDYLLPYIKNQFSTYKNIVTSWSMEENISGFKNEAVDNYRKNLERQNNQLEKDNAVTLKKELKPDNEFGFTNVVQIVGLTIAAIVTLVVMTIMFV